jgi:hypothetical protein
MTDEDCRTLKRRILIVRSWPGQELRQVAEDCTAEHWYDGLQWQQSRWLDISWSQGRRYTQIYCCAAGKVIKERIKVAQCE